MNRPLVSIIMPVRNCEVTIALTIRSIIDQTLTGWELLLIDDGSTDATLVEANQFNDTRIRVLRDGSKRGLPTRLNEGIAEASGELLARMDGDDVCYPERLETQVAYLRSHPDVDLVGGGVLVFGRGGRAVGTRTPPEKHEQICRRWLSGFPIAHPTFVGHTTWFRKWGFDSNTGGACDQDLLLRSFRQSCFANVPRILLGYREDSVVLRKCLRYRIGFARSLIASRHHGSWWHLGFGLSLIALKSALDVVAVGTGLQHRVLRHRARPVGGGELATWQRLWRGLAAQKADAQ